MYFVSVFPIITYAIDFKGFIGNIMVQLNILPSLFIGLAILFLMYNILQFIQSGDIKKKDEAQKMITYSIVFLFIMISIWGLVAILINTFALDSSTIKIPAIPKF